MTFGGTFLVMRDLKLETSRLTLRLMQPSDLDDLLEIFGDPKVMASFGGATFSREQMQRWMQRNLEHQSLHGYGLFSVILKSEGVLIGDCGLEHMTIDGEKAVELGYDFRSVYWNQGYATEAATAVRDYAFEVLHLPCLVSLIRVGNAASKRVSEKIGMHYVAEIRRNGISYWKYTIDSRGNRTN
jgi:RimJ/RimL family protein N-acetyltransferase